MKRVDPFRAQDLGNILTYFVDVRHKCCEIARRYRNDANEPLDLRRRDILQYRGFPAPASSSEFSPKKVCGKRARRREGDGELRASLFQLAVVFRTDHGVPHCEKFTALICRAVLGPL